MSEPGLAAILSGVPEALEPLLPELCGELRRTLTAALEAAGGVPPFGRAPQNAAGRMAGGSAPGATGAESGEAEPWDAAETARLAHAFKSASMLYRLYPLANAAGLAEDAAREGRPARARLALGRCAALLDELEAACRALSAC